MLKLNAYQSICVRKALVFVSVAQVDAELAYVAERDGRYADGAILEALGLLIEAKRGSEAADAFESQVADAATREIPLPIDAVPFPNDKMGGK